MFTVHEFIAGSSDPLKYSKKQTPFSTWILSFFGAEKMLSSPQQQKHSLDHFLGDLGPFGFPIPWYLGLDGCVPHKLPRHWRGMAKHATCDKVSARVVYGGGSKLHTLGMLITPSIRNQYNGYINPYYQVDEFIPTLGPSTYGNCPSRVRNSFNLISQ